MDKSVGQPPETELRLDRDRLVGHFEDGVGEEVDWAGDRAGFDDEVSAFA